MKRILIVDDHPILRNALRGFLELVGYWCEESSHGAEALALLEREQLVDLIITDNHMPVMNGIEFLVHLKNRLKFRDIPIIIHSGTVTQGERKEFLRKGIVAILDKPTGFQELGVVVAQVLGLETPLMLWPNVQSHFLTRDRCFWPCYGRLLSF